MTVTLNLKPEVEAGLLAQAERTGISLEQYLLSMVEGAALPAMLRTVSPFQRAHEFHDSKSFQDLASDQDVKPATNLAALAGVFSESDALDDLLEEIYRERE